jgi:hypothetical protein
VDQGHKPFAFLTYGGVDRKWDAIAKHTSMTCAFPVFRVVPAPSLGRSQLRRKSTCGYTTRHLHTIPILDAISCWYFSWLRWCIELSHLAHVTPMTNNRSFHAASPVPSHLTTARSAPSSHPPQAPNSYLELLCSSLHVYFMSSSSSSVDQCPLGPPNAHRLLTRVPS